MNATKTCNDGHEPSPAWITRAMGLAEIGCEPEDRLRNYEIEMELTERYGGEWTVEGPCPRNGEFTKSKGGAAPSGATVIRGAALATCAPPQLAPLRYVVAWELGEWTEYPYGWARDATPMDGTAGPVVGCALVTRDGDGTWRWYANTPDRFATGEGTGLATPESARVAADAWLAAACAKAT